MKLIVFFFLALPALACKLTPPEAQKRSEAAALDSVKSKTKRSDLLSRYVYPFWYVRTTKPSCVEYRVGVVLRPDDCKTTAKILGEENCH